MPTKLRHNIAIKQAKLAVVAAVCIGLLFSLAQLAHDIFQEREDTRDTVAHIMNSLKDPAAEAAYSLSPELAQKVLNGIFQNPQIKDGYLHAMFGAGETELLAELSRHQEEPHLQWLAQWITQEDQLYSLELYVSKQEEPTGLLQLRVDGGVLAQEFLERAVFIFSAGFLRNITLTFVLIIIFFRTLTKPILRITQQISEFDVERPDQSLLSIPPSHKHDEFGILINEVNAARLSVGSALKRLRLAQAEKDESMQMFHALAKTSSDIFWRTDKDFDLVVISEDLASRDLDDLLGLTGSSLKSLFENNILSAEPKNTDEYWKNPKDFRDIQLKFVIDGIPVVLAFFGTINFDQNGRFIGYLGTATNITKALQQSWEFEETQEKLRQAQKMEAVGQLTGGIAHDFNNLLAVIIGNLELIQEKFPDDFDLAKLISSAIQSSERGAKLTQQLLAFSRKQSLQPQFINLNKTIKDVSRLLLRTLGGSVTVQTCFEEDLRDCYVDPAQFENVLLNLSINARDAMPNGGTLTITTLDHYLHNPLQTSSGVLQPGHYVKVIVADTGTGMSEDVIEKSIEPFFTTKEVGKGSGMGLAMVYGFITQSVGHIVLESEIGKGTSISLYLPCAEPELQSNDQSPQITAARQ